MEKATEQILKMRSLMERMEKPLTNYQATLNESMYLNEAHEREVKDPSEIFDILDQIGNGKFVSIGTVTGANLNIPTVKKKNPATNRMKSYPDYETFGKEIGAEEQIGALVNITSYNLRYTPRNIMGKKYSEYKPAANAIRTSFGLPEIGTKENDYAGKMDYGKGIDVYQGNNAEKEGNFYVAQNTFGVHPKSITYAVNTEGHIIQQLSDEQVIPYLKAKREMDGVSALRKMEKTEEEIQDYINQMNSLKMNFRRFLGNSLLWVVATINGEPIIYLNHAMARNVEGIDVNPADFITIAKARYANDIKETN